MRLPALLVVAPPGTTFTDPADLDSIRAFVMDGTAGINLGFGTWHWGPYPIGPRVDLLNLQGRGGSLRRGTAKTLQIDELRQRIRQTPDTGRER